ncbi:MAG: hypothetical protein PHV85_02450, partial [Desulfovibrionaceae bacterium]|nr:hypothetical protein [Desulfovibrionaceae bacterium]
MGMKFIHDASQVPEGRRVCIYGRGRRGAELLEALGQRPGVRVGCFVDSFSSGRFMGLEVLCLKDFIAKYDPEKDCLVIASAFYPEIAMGLGKAGIAGFLVYERLPVLDESRSSGSHILHNRSSLLGYRDMESMARRGLADWRVARRHNLDHYERYGFPVRITTFLETRQLLDTMQESRFERLQEELGGLSEADLGALVEACLELARFQRRHYPGRSLLLPLDTVLAMLVVYKKLDGLAPGFKSILEVGPGCGYLALFLRNRADLENYSLTESCESFYILQDAVNRQLFKERFQQLVHDQAEGEWFIRPDDPLRSWLSLASSDAPKTVFHYPWWKLGALAASNARFDLVNSNANLLEFNPEALRDYLALFRMKLNKNGLFFAHCYGFESPEKDRQYLYEELYRAGFAPLFICH